MKTFVLVNPNSANKATGRSWTTIRQSIGKVLGTFDEAPTKYPGHATDLVREALKNGAERIIVVGGDGTNNEVVNGFFDGAKAINQRALLGIIPQGTGGDLRKTLGIGKDIHDCLEVIRLGNTQALDVGSVTYLDHQGQPTQRFFINITSFGIGGLVDSIVNRSSKALGGRLSFLLGTLKALARYRNKLIHVKVYSNEGAAVIDESMRINNFVVANGQYFGGGMWVAPEAQMDDGLFDVVILGDLSKREMIFQASRIYKGTHISLPKVRCLRGCRVEAASDEEVLIDMDGEQPGRLPITLTILPKAIRVLVP